MITRLRLALTCAPALVVVISGCASTGGMQNARLDAGVAREFVGRYEVIVRAARDATVQAGLAIDSFKEVNPTTTMIIAKKGSSMWSWGELVRLVVERVADDRVMVHVYTKRKLATNVTARGNYSETIFQNIDLSLR